MQWLELMRSYLTVISVLPCLCLRVAMTASIATVLWFRGMVLLSRDVRFKSELCFFGIKYSLLLAKNNQAS